MKQPFFGKNFVHQLNGKNFELLQNKHSFMKHIKHVLLIVCTILFIACTSTPNKDNGDKNSTPSGNYSAGNSDSANMHDTIHPAKPNGMDTTGEQTGRMNNPAQGSSQPKNNAGSGQSHKNAPAKK